MWTDIRNIENIGMKVGGVAMSIGKNRRVQWIRSNNRSHLSCPICNVRFIQIYFRDNPRRISHGFSPVLRVSKYSLPDASHIAVVAAARRRAFYLSISSDRFRAVTSVISGRELKLARRTGWSNFGREATAIYYWIVMSIINTSATPRRQWPPRALLSFH